MKQRHSIVHSDKFIVVVAKPPGLLSIPDRYDREAPSMQEVLSWHFEEIFVVHRLDRDTSGLMVFARNEDTHRSLSLQFERGRVRKTYHALVVGEPEWSSRTVDLPLSADADRAHRTRVDQRKGKEAATELEIIDRFNGFALVRASPRTGRTHQIRVHLAAVGHPIVCDPLYGSGDALYLSALKRKYRPGRRQERPLIMRTALHAFEIEFEHPHIGERVTFQHDIFRDMKATVNQLKKLASANLTNTRTN